MTREIIIKPRATTGDQFNVVYNKLIAEVTNIVNIIITIVIILSSIHFIFKSLVSYYKLFNSSSLVGKSLKPL